MPHGHEHHSHDHHSHSHQELAKPVAKTAPAPPVAQLSVSISDRAASELKNLMAAEGGQGSALRIGVEPGGCAGYQYSLSLATNPDADELAAESGGIKVFVRRESVPMLNGLLVDFVDSALGSGFHLKNPNAKHTCGCGNTFDA